jgi:hypothetical protein
LVALVNNLNPQPHFQKELHDEKSPAPLVRPHEALESLEKGTGEILALLSLQ